MKFETAFTMATSNIKFGPGVTKEIGYDMKKLGNRGWFLHAPCLISNIREDKRQVTFSVDGWGEKQYFVLVSGIEKEPGEVDVREIYQESSKTPVFKPAVKEFHSEHNCLVITLKGKSQIRIR